MGRRDPFPKWDAILEEVRQEMFSEEEGAKAPSSSFLRQSRTGRWVKTIEKYKFNK